MGARGVCVYARPCVCVHVWPCVCASLCLCECDVRVYVRAYVCASVMCVRGRALRACVYA